MYVGVDYYPEQWEPGMLDEDLDRMVELGCNVIRIGEFAWHLMEPQEGKFDFPFFDRVIAAAGKRGLSVIFGTPTASPPAWLAHAHPDILSQSETGVPRAYGGRHVACYSSEPYLERCRAIVTALAEHYRGAAKGAEQFCYGLLDPDNVPRRRFFEAQSFFSEVKQFEAALSAPMRAEAAILYDYDSLASFRIQRQSLLLEPEREMKRLHGILHRSGVGVDVIPASRDFSGYKLVIVPNMAVTDQDFTARLKAYVASGGVALVTFRTAVKDRDNNLVFGKSLPVDLTDMLGLCVVETESLQEPDAVPLASESGRGTAGVFRDMVVPQGAHVLWRYDDEFYRQYAAVTRCDYGLGAAYYLGTVPDAAVLDALFGELMSRAVLERLELPEGVECAVRGEGERRVRILMNHNARPVTALGRELGPFGVEVIPI